jgi:protocatechuate 3,4-dioxygenase beta subunit
MRDGFIGRTVLHTSQYPDAVFVPTQVSGLPSPLPTSGSVSFKLTGNLTVQDVTKPVTWDVTGTVLDGGNQAKGTATTSFTFEDFNLNQPKVPLVLSIVDHITLEVDVTLQRQGSGAASNSNATPASTTPAGAPSGSATGTPASTASAASTANVQAPIACTGPAALTPAMTEGPYFKAGSPQASNLVQQGMTGTKLTLTGYVLTSDCQPVANATLDFWQADAQGQYDNSGYTLRGHQVTDATGRYQLETVIPGLYPGRTEHIHVKVQPPNGAVLTTQLFFPGVAQNQEDQIFDQRLLVQVQSTSSGSEAATFNFVVQ